MSAFKNLVSIFTEPGKAMEAVLERSMILLPLFLMVVGNAALLAWYYSSVDFPWLQEHLLAAMEPEQRAAARGFMNQGMLIGSSVVGVVIGVPVVLLLTAVYYLLAAKVVGNELSFGKWFAFATWTSVPSLLQLPVMAAQILMSSNGQLTPEALNALSLNQLLFGFPTESPWAALLGAFNLTMLWTYVVAVIGMQRWTSKSMATSTVIVLLPQVVIFGLWAVFAAIRAAA